MAMFVQTITVADVLAGLTTDSTKWAGANIANLDQSIATTDTNVEKYAKRRIYQNTTHTWDENADGDVEFWIDTAPIVVGLWYFRFKFTTNGNSGDGVRYYPIWEDDDNKYYFFASDSATTCPDLYKQVVGAGTQLISGGETTDTSEHYVELTKDGCGNFEIFYDGTTKGTCSETFNPTPNGALFKLHSSAGNSVVEIYEAYVERL